jgi:hypothetical protein
MAQTAEQLQAARQLAAEYGLTGADFYQHKQSKSFLISRTGIEKIQYKAGIEVGFDAEKIEPEFAAVKATATRKVKVGDAKTATKLTIQTFGSASKLNCQVSYFLEMAEKRALSRAVLKLTDFYQLGVYGEDEMPPISFRAEEAAPSVVVEAPKKPQPEASAPALVEPAPFTTSAPNSPEQGYDVPAREDVLALLAGCKTSIEVRNLWEGPGKQWQLDALTKAAFTQRGNDIKASIKADADAPAQPRPTVPGRPLADEAGQPIVYADNAQKEEINRLLNNPQITRQEKTITLLGINRLLPEQATAKIAELRAKIEQRENRPADDETARIAA